MCIDITDDDYTGDILIGEPDKDSDLIPQLPRTIEVVSGHGSIYLEVKSWLQGLKLKAQ